MVGRNTTRVLLESWAKVPHLLMKLCLVELYILVSPESAGLMKLIPPSLFTTHHDRVVMLSFDGVAPDFGHVMLW